MSCLLLCILAAVSEGSQGPPANRASTGGAASALTVAVNVGEGRWISPGDPVAISLNRAVDPAEGRLAVVIGTTDWTSLFSSSSSGLSYRPAALLLPSGERDLVVFLVGPTGEWQELQRTPLRVLARGGFERADAKPVVDVVNDGQVAQGAFPTSIAGARDRYQALKLNAGLQSTFVRRGSTTQAQFAVLGVTQAKDALRFATEGARAPQLDLASYLVSEQAGAATLSLGSQVLGRNRHLLNEFSTRGASAALRLGGAADLALAAVNGSSVVGWSNPVGLSDRDHQVLGATLGVELRPARPGTARLETTFLDGSRLPVSGFNQGVVNDAERSRGLGVRFLASDPGGRLLVDAGISSSAFTNPLDPQFTGEAAVVPVRKETRQARYLDVSLALLQNVPVGARAQASLSAAFRHERVDPLFRSIGASSRADVLQNVYELTSAVGQVTAQLSQTESHDNLGSIASILTTRTHVTTAAVSAPLSTMGSEGSGAPWLPTLTYALNRTHQLGDGLPPNSGFDNESQVPNQVSLNHVVGIGWQGTRARAGYQLSRSLQDNRQAGRTLADLLNLTNTISVGLMPTPALDVAADFGFDGAENRETVRTDVTRRLNVTGNWRVRRSAVTGTLGTIAVHDRAATSRSRNSTFTIQFAQTVALAPSRPDRLQGQAFVRYGWQSGSALDRVFGIDALQRSWSVNTGVTFKIF